MQYIMELGTGTVDIFNICRATGLHPPVFDIDAQHFWVTVYRPIFDEQGNRIPITPPEVKAKKHRSRSEICRSQGKKHGSRSKACGSQGKKRRSRSKNHGSRSKPDSEVIMKTIARISARLVQMYGNAWPTPQCMNR